MNEVFAVIDTETTWTDRVMSIGIVISDSATFELIDKRYYILLPYKNEGGMYSMSLYDTLPDSECMRAYAMKEIVNFFINNSVKKIFAYNAKFDYNHLPELSLFQWFDIIKIAAYKQYNKKIPDCADCFRTGRLKRNYGVENIYRLLSGNKRYFETHNALIDARDELCIMKMLGLDLSVYNAARI